MFNFFRLTCRLKSSKKLTHQPNLCFHTLSLPEWWVFLYGCFHDWLAISSGKSTSRAWSILNALFHRKPGTNELPPGSTKSLSELKKQNPHGNSLQSSDPNENRLVETETPYWLSDRTRLHSAPRATVNGTRAVIKPLPRKLDYSTIKLRGSI